MGGLIELAEYGENPENIKMADVIILEGFAFIHEA